MLDDGELGQHFGVKHLDHALVDLTPTVSNARNIEKDRTVLPEGTLLHVVDEANGREVHIDLALVFDDKGLGYIAGLGSTFHGPFCGHRFVVVNRSCKLRRAKYVRHEGMVVEAPDAVGASRFECVSQDEFPHHLQVSVLLVRCIQTLGSSNVRFNNLENNLALNLASLFSVLKIS